MFIEIIFMATNPIYPSNNLRAIQICERLKNKYSKINVIYQQLLDIKNPSNTKELFSKYKNTLFIWIKSIETKIFDLIPKNNTHVFDLVDNYLYNNIVIDNILNSNMVNCIIVNNNYMKEYIYNKTNFKGDVFIIYHHYDTIFRLDMLEKQDKLTFGFMGSLPSLTHTDNFLYYKFLSQEYPIEFLNTEDGNYYTNEITKSNELLKKDFNKNLIKLS
jgi:hypothetical protein